MNNKIFYKKGFVALTLTLSVTGIILVLVTTSAIESSTFFDQALRKEYRAMNYFYATSCLDQAILSLSHNYFFTVDQPIEIPRYYCTIIFIEKQGDARLILAKGNFQKADVYRTATVLLHDHGLDITAIE